MKKILVLIIIGVILLVSSHSTTKAYEYETNVTTWNYSDTRTIEEANINDVLDYFAMWTLDKVNLRTKADINSEVITTVDQRSEVIYISETNKFTKIKYGNYTGYIYSQYLTDKKPFQSQNNRWRIDLTDGEIDLLAKILWVECRGESDLGMYAACETIMNRIYSLEYPDSLYLVLSQENQFASWKLRNAATPDEREYEIIEETIYGMTDVLSMDVMYFSTEPRNNHIETKIGNHYFCRKD